ncbi:MAG: Omp28-related outer membrane protein [Bacteroidales bacterium]|jgi:hypothetical protein|nr:Omp28-related outer membrane protein [Bacteroidales bacterium]
MRQKLFFIFLFLLIASNSFAQEALCLTQMNNSVLVANEQTAENPIQLRYCTDVLSRSVAVSANAEVEAVIYIPKSVTNKYAGAFLTKIKVGFGPDAATNTKVFIRTSLTGDPVYTEAVNFTVGSWNEITLATPYEIKEDEDLYIGYSFKSGNVKYSSLGLDNSPKANPNGDLIRYKIGSQTSNWVHIGDQSFPNLCIIGIVEGENLPQYDVDFNSLLINPLSVININETFSISGNIRNMATETVTNLDISYKVGENEKITQSLTGLNIPSSSSFGFLIPEITFNKEEGVYPIEVSVEKINGNDDEDVSDNTQNTIIQAWNAPQTPSIVTIEPTNKNAVLEEFTGVYCQYCPDGHKKANQIKKDNPGRVSVINIHQGAYAYSVPDYRTEWGDEIAAQTGLTGYPAATVNRHVFSGSVTASDERTKWANQVSTILGQSSYVNVALNAEIDEATRKLTVFVELYYTANGASVNMLNVALLQDSILGEQSFASKLTYPEMMVNGQYQHNHMLRHLLTRQWGDSIKQTTAGTFVVRKYVYQIPEAVREIPVNLNKLEVVAFVVEGKQEIISGASANVETTTTGLSNIAVSSTVAYIYNNSLYIRSDAPVRSVDIYSVSGQKILSATVVGNVIPVERLSQGIYVVKVKTTEGEKVMKVIK